MFAFLVDFHIPLVAPHATERQEKYSHNSRLYMLRGIEESNYENPAKQQHKYRHQSPMPPLTSCAAQSQSSLLVVVEPIVAWELLFHFPISPQVLGLLAFPLTLHPLNYECIGQSGE